VKTLLLMSVIWMTFALPAVASRSRDPVRGLRRMVVWFAVFCVAYYLYVAYGHPKIFVPHE